MRRWKQRWSWIGSIFVAWAGVFVAASTASAYELKQPTEGRFVRWPSSTVELRLAEHHARELDADTVVRSLEMATDAWRGIYGAPDIIVEQGGPSEPDPYDRINSVHVLDEWPSYLGEYLAVTISTYDYGGRLLDADILINAEMPFAILDEQRPRGSFDLPSVLTHEMGHVLGLDESDVPEATMYGHLRRAQVFQRTLHEDDENGVMALYGETPAIEPVGCDASGRSSGWMFVGLWMLLLLPKRSARRPFAPVRARRRR